MAAWEYDNFDLLIETEGDGGYRARVIGAPTGESPSATFQIPFEATQLENLLLKLDPGRSGTRRVAADPQSQAVARPRRRAVRSRVQRATSCSPGRAARHGAGRAATVCGCGSGSPRRPPIAGLPWELLYDRRQNSFIAQSERTPVVRYLEVADTPRTLDVDGPLRILVVISSPTDLPELDVEAEWDRINATLAARVAQGTVQLDRLDSPPLQALPTWLRRHDVHVLHFIGHGDYDRQVQDGVLYFCDRYGRTAPVSPGVLGPYLRDHDPLRLVFLNACQSARMDSSEPVQRRWRRASSSRTAPRSSPCSSRSAAAPPPPSPASSTARSPTASPSTRRSPVPARPCSPRMRRSGPRRCSSSAIPTAGSSTTSFRCRRTSPPVRATRERRLRGPPPSVAVAAGEVNGATGPGIAAEHNPAPPAELAAGTSVSAVTPSEPDPPASGTSDGSAADSTEVLAALRTPSDDSAAVEAGPAAATLSLAVASSPRQLVGSSLTPPPDTVPATTGATPSPNRNAGRIVALLLVIVLLGYLAWWFTHRATDDDGHATPPPTTTTAQTTTNDAPTVSRQVTVAGAKAWTDSGVACEPGKSFQLVASGTVFHDPADGVGPDGSTNASLRQFNLPGLSGANHSALVASLDTKAPFTVVGGSATYTCTAAGELFLGPNDSGVDNNHGQWTVTVTPSG